MRTDLLHQHFPNRTDLPSFRRRIFILTRAAPLAISLASASSIAAGFAEEGKMMQFRQTAALALALGATVAGRAAAQPADPLTLRTVARLVDQAMPHVNAVLNEGVPKAPAIAAAEAAILVAPEFRKLPDPECDLAVRARLPEFSARTSTGPRSPHAPRLLAWRSPATAPAPTASPSPCPSTNTASHRGRPSPLPDPVEVRRQSHAPARHCP